MKTIIKSISIVVLGTTMSVFAQPKSQLYKSDYKIKPEADKKSDYVVTSKETNPFETASNYKKSVEIKDVNEFATPLFVEPYGVQTGVLANGNYKGQNSNNKSVMKVIKYKKEEEINNSVAQKSE